MVVSHPVAIITYGIKTEQGKAALKILKANPDLYHEPVDVRQLLLKDLVKSLRTYTQNAGDLQVQRSLLDARCFFMCCADLVMTILDGYHAGHDNKPHTIYCTAGIHRCDGVAKFLSHRVLNK